jgi:LysR family transcriptional regulator, transcription activator of glutamate synthase operon
VSQQIRRLAEELGVEVFRRTTHSVELTAEGRVILGYAERAERPGLRAA